MSALFAASRAAAASDSRRRATTRFIEAIVGGLHRRRVLTGLLGQALELFGDRGHSALELRVTLGALGLRPIFLRRGR